MNFHWILDMAVLSKHAESIHVCSGLSRVWFWTALCDWPFTSLWLAEPYITPADLYGSQFWSSGFF